MAPAGDDERHHPRSLLEDPQDFSRNPQAAWVPTPDGEAMQLAVRGYWHHLTACAIREKYPVDPEGELSRRLGLDERYLRRRFIGEYPVRIEELCLWAIALDDISVLPVFESAEDLFPPGARFYDEDR